MIYNSDHFIVYGWMRTVLRLSGVDLLIYAIVYDKGHITAKEAADWIDTTERQANNVLDRLSKARLIHKTKKGRANNYELGKEPTNAEINFGNIFPLREKEAKREDIKEDYPISYSLLKENGKDIDYTSDSNDIVKGDKDNIKVIKIKGIDDKNTAKDKQKDKINRFIPPTVEEVRAYCEERQNGIDSEQFVDFYSSKGWMIGKNKMKDWKAAVRTWENKRKEKERQEQKEYEATHYTELDDIF